MVGAAAGTALGALVWMAAQALAPNDMMSWGWRLVFLSSIFVTIAALIIRRKLDESPVFEEIKRALVLFPAPAFMLACQGVVDVHMSYFPEIFGSRYRYAGVTLGREFASIIGGGIAPMIRAGLLALFSNSWDPVAIYMSLVMLVSFIATRPSPETLNRDLADPYDAGREGHTGQASVVADLAVAHHTK